MTQITVMKAVRRDDLAMVHHDPRVRAYRRLARGWQIAFGLFGLLLAVRPDLIVGVVTAVAGVLGMSGTLPPPADGLDWILGISLMATLTLLAGETARHPLEVAPFRALMVAKWTSTAGFVLLAFARGTIWFVPALVDGGIAFSLLHGRRGIAARPVPVHPTRFRARRRASATRVS